MSNVGCPGDEELERFHRGELAAESAGPIEEHLRQCSLCGERSRQVQRDGELIDDLRLAVQRVADQGEEDLGARTTVLLTSFGPYDIRGLLGIGGMGRVFRAVHRQTGQEVALKLLKVEQQVSREIQARFAREAKAMAGLDHPNILRVFECPTQGEQTAMAMELALGGTLAERIAANKRVNRPAESAEVLSWALQAARGLGAAHSRGWVHRDIKPSNLLFDGAGNLKISDFGVVQAMESTTWVTGTGQQIGTPAYMSPEQCRGERVTPASDVYSLGVTMYELSTSRLPFEAEGGSPFALMLKHISEPLPHPIRFNPALPERLTSIMLKCLEKRAEDRYRNGDELCAALDLASRPPPPARRGTPAARPSEVSFNRTLVRQQLELLPQRAIVAWACRCARYVQPLNADPRVEAALALAESVAYGTDEQEGQTTSARMLARMHSLRAASLAAAYAEADAEESGPPGAAARSAAAAGACAAARCLTDAAADAVFSLENAMLACKKANKPVPVFWRRVQHDYRRLHDAKLGAVGTIGRPLPTGFWEARSEK